MVNGLARADFQPVGIKNTCSTFTVACTLCAFWRTGLPRITPKLMTSCFSLDDPSMVKLCLKWKLSLWKVIHSFFCIRYLRDNTTTNPSQGQCLYWMIIPHCLFILPADVISSCYLWPLTSHLPPIAAMLYSTAWSLWLREHPHLYLCRIPAYKKVTGVSECKIYLCLKVIFNLDS